MSQVENARPPSPGNPVKPPTQQSKFNNCTLSLCENIKVLTKVQTIATSATQQGAPHTSSAHTGRMAPEPLIPASSYHLGPPLLAEGPMQSGQDPCGQENLQGKSELPQFGVEAETQPAPQTGPTQSKEPLLGVPQV